MAARHNIEAENGSTFIFYVKYMDDDNNAVDLSGYTLQVLIQNFYIFLLLVAEQLVDYQEV